MGGFSDDNLLCIDQRGFKVLIQAEAAEFLKPTQLMLNSTVKSISYSKTGVSVTLTSGKKLSADYALVTFSVGVLQNTDVTFDPPLPDWKQEAINSMTMATYTKIFLQFPHVFWFDTQVGILMLLFKILCTHACIIFQMALYADEERGRYPVWQSLDVQGFLPGSGIIFVTVTVKTLSSVVPVYRTH